MNFPFVCFQMIFKGQLLLQQEHWNSYRWSFSMCSPRTVLFGGEKLHFLQFLTNTSTIISFRTSLMATGWTLSLPIERSLSFVNISNFKFVISLFLAEICASSLSVFFSILYHFTTSHFDQVQCLQTPSPLWLTLMCS